MKSALLAALLVAASTAASADGIHAVHCTNSSSPLNVVWYSGLFLVPASVDTDDIKAAYQRYLLAKGLRPDFDRATCSYSEGNTRAEAVKRGQKAFDYETAFTRRSGARVEVLNWVYPGGSAATDLGPEPELAPEPDPARESASTQPSTPASPAEPSWEERRAQREAEYQRKVREYEDALARQRAQVAAFEQAQSDLTRQKAQQTEAARRALADHQADLRRHEAEVEAQRQAAAAAQAEYQQQLASPRADRKPNYSQIPVKGTSGATRAEAERNFLTRMDSEYRNRTKLTYDCYDLWGRWVCSGVVEFGTASTRKPIDRAPTKASSQ